MRRRSRKREASLEARPAVRSVALERTPVRPVDESLREFVRRLPCAVCLRPTLGSDPCHHHAKRRFGDWIDRDGRLVGNLYPACREHHREQHDTGISTFSSERDVDLDAVCELVGHAYVSGWSDAGLGAEAIARRGYAGVDVSRVADGELPF